MRKTIIYTLCLLLLAALVAVPVFAAGSVSISLSPSASSVGSGDTVTVTVSASVDTCGSGGIEVSFDSSVFQLTDGQWTLNNTFLSDFSVGSRDGVFAFDGNRGVSGNVFRFTLKVKDGAALGNSNVSVTFKADSKTAGKTVGIHIACDHTYDNSCDTNCNRCGASRSISHSWNSGKVIKAATCTANGSKEYTCRVCGTKKTESVSKTAHTYDHNCDTACNVCGRERSVDHAYAWTLDGDGHVQKCTACGATQEQGAHTMENTTSGDASGHGYKCSTCGLIPKAESHVYETDCDPTCDSCGYERTVTHAFSEKLAYDSTNHWHACMICGEKTEAVAHTPGEAATETTDQICEDCGYVIQPAGNHTHTMAGDWLSNDVGHWFLCACLSYTEPEKHTLDAGVTDKTAGTITYRCTVCGFEVTEELALETEPSPTESETPAEEPGTITMKLWMAGIVAVLILVAGFGLGIIIGRISRA